MLAFTLQRRMILGVALLGTAIAAYLTYIHYADIKPLCLSNGGCETVQSSHYSKLAGIPVALLGLLGYVVIVVSVAVRAELADLVGAFAALVGFGFSAYLTYRELFTIEAICLWCVTSAVLLTLLAVLTVRQALTVDWPEATREER